jgi:hypothetical protein
LLYLDRPLQGQDNCARPGAAVAICMSRLSNTVFLKMRNELE